MRRKFKHDRPRRGTVDHDLRRIVLAAFAAVLAGCDSQPSAPSTNSLATAAGEQLLPSAAPRCSDAFAGSSPLNAPAAGSVAGPGVGLFQYDFSQLEERYRERNPPLTEWRHRDLSFLASVVPHRALATSPDAVKLVACIRETRFLVGYYEPSKTPAVRLDWDVRLLLWPGGEVIAQMTFRGPDPDQKAELQGYGNCTQTSETCATKSGGDPFTQAHDWLDGLIAP